MIVITTIVTLQIPLASFHNISVDLSRVHGYHYGIFGEMLVFQYLEISYNEFCRYVRVLIFLLVFHFFHGIFNFSSTFEC